MKTHSNNTYSTTDGSRVTRKHIEARIRRAKEEVVAKQVLDKGYNFCQECGRSQVILDCAHKIPVKVCLGNGMAELAWDGNNIRILCRECHREHDNTNLKFKNK